MKKALSLALALALCMGLFSGCGTTARQGAQEQQLQKVTVGEVTHSILTPPKR